MSYKEIGKWKRCSNERRKENEGRGTEVAAVWWAIRDLNTANKTATRIQIAHGAESSWCGRRGIKGVSNEARNAHTTKSINRDGRLSNKPQKQEYIST